MITWRVKFAKTSECPASAKPLQMMPVVQQYQTPQGKQTELTEDKRAVRGQANAQMMDMAQVKTEGRDRMAAMVMVWLTTTPSR